jgi:uncharacterized 2Fe-2S/4Fe-4S cluster protein (DUF4445 family)
VRYLDGDVPPAAEQDRSFFSASKLAAGWRRACLSTPQMSCTVELPQRSRAKAARFSDDGRDQWIDPHPVVERRRAVMQEPTLADLRSDADRLLNALRESSASPPTRIDHALLKTLRRLLVDNDWTVDAVVRDQEVIALLPRKAKMLGLAVDLGTTNIAATLVDLQSGKTLAVAGAENPQKAFGADLIARLGNAAADPAIALQMQRDAAETINALMRQLCAEVDQPSASVVDLVIAGNTVMQHLLWGYPVAQLGQAPFVSVSTGATDVKARELGLNAAPGSGVYAFRNISGFIGGDHTALLLSIAAERERRTVLALDVGTNTEVSLLHRGRITSLSCPSGPALEAGNISCGMRAAEGAIESIRVTGSAIETRVIGQASPVGLCGSAVLDTVAQFYRADAINFRGRIAEGSAFARRVDGALALMICESPHGDIYFTQHDVRNVQLAKGAVRAGIEILLDDAGLTAKDLDHVVIAGAFGLHLDYQSLLDIGMLPVVPASICERVGNAALIGAKLALLSGELRHTSTTIALSARYVEQAGSAEFMKRFMAQLNLPTSHQ